MAKFNGSFVAALLACLVAVNASGLQDEDGNPCPPCVTTREYNLVCGTNGRTYDNPSVLKCHSECLKSDLKHKHFGRCDDTSDVREKMEESSCRCAVTANLRPVCGTNGETYPNISALRCDVVCKKTDIEVKHEGACA